MEGCKRVMCAKDIRGILNCLPMKIRWINLSGSKDRFFRSKQNRIVPPRRHYSSQPAFQSKIFLTFSLLQKFTFLHEKFKIKFHVRSSKKKKKEKEIRKIILRLNKIPYVFYHPFKILPYFQHGEFYEIYVVIRTFHPFQIQRNVTSRFEWEILGEQKAKGN